MGKTQRVSGGDAGCLTLYITHRAISSFIKSVHAKQFFIPGSTMDGSKSAVTLTSGFSWMHSVQGRCWILAKGR